MRAFLLGALMLPMAAGCGTNGSTSHDEAVGTQRVPLGLAPITPMHDPSLSLAQSANDPRSPVSLNGGVGYFGGPVLTSIQVVMVLYGDGGTDGYLPELTSNTAPNMPSFFGGVLNSPYIDWLDEYDTTAPLPEPRTDQHIGRGAFVERVMITPSAANNGPTIDDSNIQAELSAKLASGALPAPVHDPAGAAITYYAVFIPHGKVVTAGSEASCTNFCAYHSGIANAGGKGPIYYGVHPDLRTGSGCEHVCGGAATDFGRFSHFASHEVLETITDPAGGGWFASNGEIGDLCVGTEGTIVGGDGLTYVVQTGWSNVAFQCIVARDGAQGSGGAGGAAGNGGASGAGGNGGASSGGAAGMNAGGGGGVSGVGGASGAGAAGASGGGAGGSGAGGSGGVANGGAAGNSGKAGQGGASGNSAGSGGKTSAGSGGGPTNPGGPCANLCANPASFTINGSFQSGSLGTGAVCLQTTSPVHGGTCGNFVNPRQLSVNGQTRSCNGSNWPSVPAARNGGYCIQTTAGNQPWAYVAVW
jgi:hypothetical protein